MSSLNTHDYLQIKTLLYDWYVKYQFDTLNIHREIHKYITVYKHREKQGSLTSRNQGGSDLAPEFPASSEGSMNLTLLLAADYYVFFFRKRKRICILSVTLVLRLDRFQA